MSGQADELDCAFDRLGPAVREENTLKTRQSAQLLSEAPLIFVVVEVGDVDELCGLVADGLDDTRVGVADRIDAQAGDEIQIAAPIQVKQKDAFPASKSYRITIVGLKKAAAFKFDDFFEASHGRR